MILGGCGGSTERELEKEMEFEESKAEIYASAYEEGYRDAVRAVVEEMPGYLVDVEEVEDSLYMIFDDGEYAEEIRDLIFSNCEIYENRDFAVEYSKDEMDYGY